MAEPKRGITDTSKKPPAQALSEMAELGPSGAILADEAQGQLELVRSMKLPTDGSELAKVAELGIKFGPVDKDDPIFRDATLPAGWRKVPEPSHSMWSYVVDEKGRRRADVFYKAASYDRHAHISPHQYHYRYVIKIGDEWYEHPDWKSGHSDPAPKTTKDLAKAYPFTSAKRARDEIARSARFREASPKVVRVVQPEDELYRELVGPPEPAEESIEAPKPRERDA